MSRAILAQRAALARRHAQDHRAGRGRGRPLRQLRHRHAPPRAAHQRRARRLVAGARAAGRGRPGPRPHDPRGAGRALGAGLPRRWSGRTPASRPSTSRPRPSPSSPAWPWARGRPPAVAVRVSLEKLRAIPWVFSWSQARLFLPAWYGLGTAVEAFEAGARRRRDRVAAGALPRVALPRPASSTSWRWPWPRSTSSVAQRYAGLAPKPDAERIWELIRAEYERTVAAVLRISGRERPARCGARRCSARSRCATPTSTPSPSCR